MTISVLFNTHIGNSTDIAQPIDLQMEYHSTCESGEKGIIICRISSNMEVQYVKLEILSPEFVWLDRPNPVWMGSIARGEILEFKIRVEIAEHVDLKIKVVLSGHSGDDKKISSVEYLFFHWDSNHFQINGINLNEIGRSSDRLQRLANQDITLYNLLASKTFSNYDDPIVTLAADSLKISGMIQWADSGNQPRPFIFGLVELVCKTQSGKKILCGTSTNQSGRYSLTVAQDPSLYGYDAYIRISTKGLEKSPAGSTGIVEVLDEVFRDPYYAVSEPFTMQSNLSEVLKVDITIIESVDRGACSVFQNIIDGWLLVKQQLDLSVGKVVVYWPSTYSTSTFNDTIRVLQADRWDRDVLLHEYGHCIDRQFNITQTPGGDHVFDQNLSNRYDFKTAERLAWGEGWADYFSVGIQYPETGDSYYDDSEDIHMHVNLEGPIKHPGSDCEASVAAILWDIIDEPNEPFDSLFLGFSYVWKPSIDFGPIESINHFITCWQSQFPAFQNEINTLYAEYTKNKSLSIDSRKTQDLPNFMVCSFPNPFNSSTAIQYYLPEPGFVIIKIFNQLGEKIKLLGNDTFTMQGWHRINWDGKDENQVNVVSGNYYIMIQVNQIVSHCQLTLVR